MCLEGMTLQIILGEQLGQSVHNTRFGENKRIGWYLGLDDGEEVQMTPGACTGEPLCVAEG